MTRRGVAVSILCLALAGCGQGDGTGGADAWPAERTFVSTSVTEQGRDRPLVPGTRIELGFSAGGRLSAQAGCNHLGGSGRLHDGRLVVTDLATTDMACDPDRMDQDDWLAGFLGSGPNWTLSGDILVLSGGGVEIRLADREVTDPDQPLVGTRWVVDTIITGDTASSVPAGATAFIELDSAGGFTGSTGCTDMSGRAEVRGTTIVFMVTGSLPACTGDRGTLHQAVVSTLAGAVSYRVDGASLMLTGPAGNGLGLRGAS